MRSIDSSQFMEGSELVQIAAVTLDKRRLNEFSMYFRMKRPNDDSKKKGDILQAPSPKKN
jgi:hypothetical protein